MKIIFMGTPDFAVPTLQSLHDSCHEIMLVITQPDRPKGRGQKRVISSVKEKAVKLGCEVFQPESVKTRSVYDKLAALRPDVFVVVAYGHILPERLLLLPRIGAINIHASLLPGYRGAAPIQWAIINREEKTGVTTMFMDRGMDTGDILLTAETTLLPQETTESLHDRLAAMGASLLMKTLEGLEKETIQPMPQNSENATYAPLLKKADGHIDWRQSPEALDALIRGMNPWPGTFTFLQEKRLKIFRAQPLSFPTEQPPGTVLEGFPGELRIAAGGGVLSILEIQGASGKRMAIEDFLRGCTLPFGTVLE
jgi:methionyl-tRNA formyltransferase